MQSLAALLLLAGSAIAAPYAQFTPSSTQGIFARQTASGTVTASAAATTDAFCTVFQDPDSGVDGYCQCSDGSHLSFVTTGSNPCPYTAAASSAVPMTTSTSYDPSCTDGASPKSNCYSLLLPDYINE
jgi:hypothetical protein